MAFLCRRGSAFVPISDKISVPNEDWKEFLHGISPECFYISVFEGYSASALEALFRAEPNEYLYSEFGGPKTALQTSRVIKLFRLCSPTAHNYALTGGEIEILSLIF